MSEFLALFWGNFESWAEVIRSPWITPLIAAGWVFLLWMIKKYVFYRLHKWSLSTATHWDTLLIEALSFPLNFLVLASGMVVLMRLLPLAEHVQRMVGWALQGCIIFAIANFADRFFRLVLQSKQGSWGMISQGVIKGVVRGFIAGIAALIFLDLVGISITPILASLGVGSLAIGLALQDTLSNFFAGIHLSVDRPIRPGDYVKVDSGEEGYVIDVGWRTTRIQTLPNNVVVIPNSKLTSSHITNYHLPDKEMAVLVPVGVHYASDLEHVERVTCEVAQDVLQRVQGGVAEFKPFIRYHTFGDSSIHFTVILRGREYVDQYLIKHEFVKALHARYHREGIVIPFPIRTLDISENLKTTLLSRSSDSSLSV